IIVLSVTFIGDALQVMPRALLQRQLRFRSLAWLQALQVTATALVVAGGARAGLNYWALALGTITGSIVVTTGMCALQPFSMTWPKEVRNLTGSFAGGWRMLVSRAAWYGCSN